MSELAQTSDFKSIVVNNIPLIDVRAPIEFQKGAFPNAVNLPLINNEERHLVGITYKEKGNAEAIKLGYKLVSEEVKQQRVQAWMDFIKSHPKAMLYCFRGGQRSKISQELISQSGKEIVRLKGGYKAFRNYLLKEIEESPAHFNPLVLGGRTGCGKTILLKKIKNAIDLEGLANHRGSSFGRRTTPQPTQIDFENALAYDLILKMDKGYQNLLFEDEGKHVGSLYLPDTFAAYLATAPLIILETPLEERIEITFDEYIRKGQEDYQKFYHDDYLHKWSTDVQDAMSRIQRRLGGARYKIVCEMFETALKEQIQNGSLARYKELLGYLLTEYYDPMYDYQIEKKSSKILFRGSKQEIEHYFNLRSPTAS